MSIKVILLILLTACLGTALAITAKEREASSGEVVGAAIKNARTDADLGPVSEMHFDLSAIKRPMPKNTRTTGLFESKSWYAPPVVQPAPAYVPSVQSATPSLPFTFIGRMIDGNEVTLFLAKNDQQYIVKESDVLDGIYRIEKIGEGEAVLTYLPGNIQQTLLFNTSSAVNSLIGASEFIAPLRPVIPVQQMNSN